MENKAREDKLRRCASKLGIGVQKRYNPTFGEDGYLLCDLTGNYVLAGAEPVPYSLTLGEAEEFIEAYAVREGR